MLGRVSGVFEGRLFGLDQCGRARSLVPGRVLLFVHARGDHGSVSQTDVRHVRVPLNALYSLAGEITVALRLAVRIEFPTADRQIILSNDPLGTLVSRGRPRVSLFGATMEGGQAAPIAALAGIAYVLAGLRQIRDALLLIGSRRRDRVQRFGGGRRGPSSVEHRVGHVRRRGDDVFPVMTGLGHSVRVRSLYRLTADGLPELRAARLARTVTGLTDDRLLFALLPLLSGALSRLQVLSVHVITFTRFLMVSLLISPVILNIRDRSLVDRSSGHALRSGMLLAGMRSLLMMMMMMLVLAQILLIVTGDDLPRICMRTGAIVDGAMRLVLNVLSRRDSLPGGFPRDSDRSSVLHGPRLASTSVRFHATAHLRSDFLGSALRKSVVISLRSGGHGRDVVAQ